MCSLAGGLWEIRASPEKEHIIVVPDMHYAEYIKSWFEPGCATIDTQNSYTTTNQTKQNQDKERRLNIIINIRTEKLHNKKKIKETLEKVDVSLSSYKRYLKEFKEELEQLNLYWLVGLFSIFCSRTITNGLAQHGRELAI